MGHQKPFHGYLSTFAIITHVEIDFPELDQIFLLNTGHFVGDNWIVEDPLGKLHVLKINMSLPSPRIESGWREFMIFYGLSGKHWCVFEMVSPSYFHVTIYDGEDNEIAYVEVVPPTAASATYVGEDEEVQSAFEALSVSDSPAGPFQLMGVQSPLPDDVNFLLDEPLFTGESYDAIPNADVPLPVQEEIQQPHLLQMSLTTRLSPYRAYGSQYVLPKKVGEYVRQIGLRQPWRIRGPNGIEMKIKILHKPEKNATKLAKGWRKFCKDNGIHHGQKISMNFSDGVSRFIDFKVLD